MPTIKPKSLMKKEGLPKNVSVPNSNNDQRAKRIGEPPYPKKVTKSGRHDDATDTAGVAGYDSNENKNMKLTVRLREFLNKYKSNKTKIQ